MSSWPRSGERSAKLHFRWCKVPLACLVRVDPRNTLPRHLEGLPRGGERDAKPHFRWCKVPRARLVRVDSRLHPLLLLPLATDSLLFRAPVSH